MKRDRNLQKLEQTLPPERFKHTLRVEKTALRLAERWGVSKRKASLAALLHDCSRRYDRQQLLRQAKRLGLKIDAVRKAEPKLFHAEISAYLAQKEFGVKEKDILRAIRRHTVGSTKMSKLDKIVYLADHIEEGRSFQGVNKIRALAYKDLNRAIVESTNNTIKYLLKENLPIYAGTIETRNYYLLSKL